MGIRIIHRKADTSSIYYVYGSLRFTGFKYRLINESGIVFDFILGFPRYINISTMMMLELVFSPPIYPTVRRVLEIVEPVLDWFRFKRTYSFIVLAPKLSLHILYSQTTVNVNEATSIIRECLKRTPIWRFGYIVEFSDELLRSLCSRKEDSNSCYITLYGICLFKPDIASTKIDIPRFNASGVELTRTIIARDISLLLRTKGLPA